MILSLPTALRSWVAWIWLPAAIGVLAVASLGAGVTTFAAGEPGELERYLARLGLSDLQAELLERSLTEADDAAERQALARRLADVYAGQLVTAADDSVKFQATMSQIQALIERVPEAKTPLLEVMLLQADYFRAESQINRWLVDQGNAEARSAAAEILQRIAPALDQRQAELSEDVSRRVEAMERLPSGSELEDAERDLRRVQSVAGRAMYFAATANYYLSLVSGESAPTGFKRAQEIYRKILGIETSYRDYDAAALGLSSIWRARALIGLALAEAALGNGEASEQCFSWLEDRSVPPVVRDQVPYWKLRALRSSGQYEELLDYARRQLSTMSSSGSDARAGFCVGLVRTGFATSDPSQRMQQIGRLGLAGLVKLGRTAAALQLIGEYQVELSGDAGFYLRWLQGQQLFQAAELSKEKVDYERAAAVLKDALQTPEAGRDVHAASQCRTQLAWCYYRLDQLEEAARLFEQAAEGLEATDDPAAAKSAWNAFLTYQRLATQQPRFVSSAVDVLKRIQRDFPMSSFAKDAEYRIGKLQQEALSPEQMIGKLAAVPSDSDSYLPALYDICTTRFRIWREASGNAKRAARNELVEAVDNFLEASVRDGQPGRRVTACLLAVQAFQSSDPPDLRAATRYLERARSAVAALPQDDRRAAEFHYRAMQVAEQSGDTKTRDRHADWIVQEAAGSPYERNALILVVRAAERALQSAPAEEKAERREAAFRAWSRLAELLGKSPEKIKASKNARIASSKLAQLAMSLGRHQLAGELLENLLAVDPKNKSYLRRAALAHFEAGEFASSLRHWQTLLVGLSKDSQEWYEAKYYQLVCLQRLDRERFARAAQQFQLLYPRLGRPPWQERFAELLSE